jgi:hypothetical protein
VSKAWKTKLIDNHAEAKYLVDRYPKIVAAVEEWKMEEKGSRGRGGVKMGNGIKRKEGT